MTVKEYSKKIIKLLEESEGKVDGLRFSKDSNIKLAVINFGDNPALVFCKVDKDNNPTEVVHCLEISDIASARSLQIWTGEAMQLLTSRDLQNADIDLVSGTQKDNN